MCSLWNCLLFMETKKFPLLFFLWQFSKESQKYIEETKLRVLLTSAPNSPAKPLADAVLMQEASYENLTTKEPHYSPVLLPVNAVTKQEPAYDTSKPKDTLQNGIEIFPRPEMVRIPLCYILR